MDLDGKAPIACSSCAKAKAKCDKKVPCTRCASKRKVCQPRTARRSGDTSTQHNRSNEEPWEPLTLESSNIMDTTAPWSTMFPTSTSSNLSGSGPNPTASHRSKPSQLQASNKRPSSNVSQDFLHSVFALSPANINDSLSPVREPFLDMELDEIDTHGDNGMLSMEGMDYPSDFSVPPMPDYALPIDEMRSSDNHGDLETHRPSANAVSDSGRASGSPLGAYRSEVGSSSEGDSPNASGGSTAMTTTGNQNSVLEDKAVFATQDRWSYFQCNPPNDAGPFSKTASIYLERLEHALESEDAWQQRDWQPQAVDTPHDGFSLQVESLSSYAREKLIAVTQAILQKASGTHHIDSRSQRSAAFMQGRGFITLPPPVVLEYFLIAYVRRYEQYYACVPAGTLKPNEVMQAGNTKASCLLLLLMIAQGAAVTPTVEARALSSGLTEACRISLHDLEEIDFELVQNLMVLQCGLLYTNVAVWSGDKWHMEIAIGRRGLYISVLRSVGLLDFQYARPSREECHADPEKEWKKWKEQEGRTRLVVSWILVDQELGLFLDQAPLLSLSCIRTTMPDPDQLWEANSPEEWLRVRDRAMGVLDKPRMSIRDLFRFFMDGELANPNVHLLTTQLRLLLHPIQSLVIHLQQILSCIPDGSGNRNVPQAMTKEKTLLRLREVQSLLGQWYSLASRCSRNTTHPSPATYANLIIYHLLSLNTLCCLPEIERFARGEVKIAQLQPYPILKINCAEDAEQVFFHCGQIFRLLRLIPEDVRPPWWPAAVYRAALAAWMTSMTKATTRSLLSSLGRKAYQPFAIDAVTPEDPTLVQYLQTGEGQPMLSKKDGTKVSLEFPQNILLQWVDLLSEKLTTQFQDGIRAKLVRLVERWKKWKVQ